ncbi:MAG TPA: hybrid-cluster NAD(P)-dependent oxidoreductase [Turneriella sp.]|nr:hybrid-cluster NAD(P)-dependent oxidoreductase [Turneriella sp.]
MTVAAVQDKLPQAVFALFVWQCDLLSEVTAAEAEAFFRFLDSAGTYGLSKEACEELQRSYSKQWRDYLRSGAMRPEQLNQFVNQVDGSARQALLGLLQALTDAAPRKKRQLQSSLSNLLNRLVNGHDAALTGLQAIYRESRFYGDEVADAAPAAPAEAVVATETTVKVVEETHVVSAGTTAVAETTTQATVSSNQRVMAVHKMVPWTEHDAVSPERLQFWTKGTRLMRCIGIVDRSHDFRSFQFVSEEPTLFFYKPGQFVTLELTIDGKRYLRSYTISSSPSRPHLIEISVKRVKGGLVSNYLHDHLHIGDSVLMKPPGGKFHCFDTTSDKYLFLAAGSGVTPMLSMARWWHDIGAQPDVIFFHSIREPEDAVFTEDMMMFTSANRKFKYLASFTSPQLPEHWPGMKGRFSEDKLLQIAPDFKERMVFTCGPDSFMKNVKLILEKNGFEIKERFRQESFGAPREKGSAEPTPITVFETKAVTQPKTAPKKPAETGDAVVHFSLSAMEIFGGDMDVPILDLAEEVGVQIPSSCRSGTCGTCRALKIRGEVECDDSPALTDVDREAGYILTCVSRAKNYVELEV